MLAAGTEPFAPQVLVLEAHRNRPECRPILWVDFLHEGCELKDVPLSSAAKAAEETAVGSAEKAAIPLRSLVSW